MLPANHLTTAQSSFRDFFPPHVVTFVSDRSADFKLSKDTPKLTKPQNTFLTRELGFRIPEVLTIRQVHGHKIVVAARKTAGKSSVIEDADGILTDRHDLAIAVRTADCLSVFLYDPRHEAIGLVHTGWRGTQERIGARAVMLMRTHWGTRPRDLRVAFGPAIRACCYQVGAPFLQHFPLETVRRKEGYFFDLPQANRNQLAEAGVDAANIMDCGVCTHCELECFSYRREGESAGRMISLIMLKHK